MVVDVFVDVDGVAVLVVVAAVVIVAYFAVVVIALDFQLAFKSFLFATKKIM